MSDELYSRLHQLDCIAHKNEEDKKEAAVLRGLAHIISMLREIKEPIEIVSKGRGD